MMEWYWYLYDNCSLFRYVRDFYLYDLKIDWRLQIVAVLMIILLTVILWGKCKRQKVTRSQAFARVNLPVYVFLLFSSLVFSRCASTEISVKLQPFWKEIAILSGETKYIQTLIQNLMMLVPYGILLPMARQVSLRITALSGCLISVLIEMLQLITKGGFCEVADVLHNTLGAVMGYGIFYIASKMCKKIEKSDKST